MLYQIFKNKIDLTKQLCQSTKTILLSLLIHLDNIFANIIISKRHFCLIKYKTKID